MLAEVEKHKGILFSKLSNVATNNIKKKTWDGICTEMNSSNTHHKRSVEEIRKKWTTNMSSAKQKVSHNRREARKTGGGPPPEEIFSMEDQVVGIIGDTPIDGIDGGIDTASFTETSMDFRCRHILQEEAPTLSRRIRARRSCKAGGKPYRLTSTLYRVKPGKGGLRMILRPKHASFPSVCPPTYTVLPPNEGLKLKICKNKPVLAEGYRLLNLDLLRKHILQITLHVIQCPKVCDMKDIEPLKLFFDERNLGLASVMFAECQGCHKQFKFTSSPMLSNDMFDVNVRGVWGSMVTGDGGAQLGETMATFSCPSISSNSFTKIETEISKWWLDTLQEDILAAGIEERNLAIDRNDFFQGVPAITVICDGGWSKRAHKHTYNAFI
ncbi:Hypothetical predicted protein [Mytilus galloprovincialis]|uniref:Nuclear apoptosis-inducing factor 1 n=1 Tax=Mytilus galloprovincialis TaxID=29158 RepID=A0A8B6EDL4_MYTGA|nr:Hypothetical predicted protein [Mytilus galloprovincialis]